MTIKTSDLPRLSGNTPTAVLGWFKGLEAEGILVHPDDGWSEMTEGNDPLIDISGERLLDEDLKAARELCKEYKVCLYTIGMVARKAKPFISVYMNREGFGYSLLSDTGSEVLKIGGFDSRAEVYETLTDNAQNQLEMTIEDYFIADICHYGSWLMTLGSRQQLPLVEKAIIGDFGPVFCAQNNVIERKRIEHTLQAMKESADGADFIDDVIYEFGPIVCGQNKALEESMAEAKLNAVSSTEPGTDFFMDMITGRAICNPYDQSDAPATSYGYSYIQWYLKAA